MDPFQAARLITQKACQQCSQAATHKVKETKHQPESKTFFIALTQTEIFI